AEHDIAFRIGADHGHRYEREQLAALRALQRDQPAQQLHRARTAGRVEHERLRLERLQLRRRRGRLLRDLRADRTRVPALVALLLALRAELLLEHPEPGRPDLRMGRRCPGHARLPLRAGGTGHPWHSWHSWLTLGHSLRSLLLHAGVVVDLRV